MASFGRCKAFLMSAVKASSGSGALSTKTSVAKPKRSSNSAGLRKAVPVSPQLGKFLGTNEASRAEVVKKVWEYIKLQNLQNPADKRQIFCDEKLKTIFNGKDTVGFLEIAKLLSPHFVKSS